MSIITINELKADRDNDARLWTPLDCLRATVRDIESGELQPVQAVYIAMLRKSSDGQATSFPFYAAGATPLEMRAILTQHIYDICERFRQ